MFRVLQPCLSKMVACPVHVVKRHTTLLLSAWSISRHSLQLPDVVNGQMACGEDIMNVANGLRLKRHDVRALIHIEHRLDRAELGRVRQSDDFEIALLQHSAVISRAPLLDRRTGRAGAPMKAPAGQGETESPKGPFAGV